MSTRWVIATPPSRTVACKGCKRVVSKFAVYRAHDGRTKLCRPCVLSADGTPPAVTITSKCSPTCRRLPRHKGEHKPVKHARIAA